MAVCKIQNPDNINPWLNAPASGTNLNTLKTTARYQIGNIAQYGNAPTGIGSSGSLEVEQVRTYIRQVAYLNSGAKFRFSFDGGSNWTSW